MKVNLSGLASLATVFVITFNQGALSQEGTGYREQLVRSVEPLDAGGSPAAEQTASEKAEQREEVMPLAKPPSEDEVRLQKAVDKYLAEKEEAAKKKEKEAKELAAEEGYIVGSDLAMTGAWNNGLELATKNKDFRIHVGGRYQLDTSWYSVDQAIQHNIGNQYGDGIDFRRARLRVDGTMYETIDFATEIDFVNALRAGNQNVSVTNPGGFVQGTTNAFTDFWWQLREVPVLGTVRMGQQKEGIGFEHLVSSRYLPFMERSFNQDAFYGGTFNGFNPGIQFYRNLGVDERSLIQAGIFKPVNNVFAFNTGTGDYSVVGRATHLLWYESEGESLLHVGMSGKQATGVSQAGFDGRVQTFRTRDAIRSGLASDWPVPAGINLVGDDLQMANLELAGVQGGWTMQGEYTVSSYHDARLRFSDPVVGNAVYHGGYVQLMRFLTSDHDHYNKQTATFERLKPRENFFLVRGRDGCSISGLGAIQVGARYNYLNLNSHGLNGGILNNLTTGLNWFWNPNMKLQFDYSATQRNVADTVNFANGSGWAHAWGARIACDF